MATDAPLGFPDAFVQLISELKCVDEGIDSSGNNPYLFRQTEIYLYNKGLAPLSAIKDMIGSQATKGMHVLAKLAPIVQSCGVWTDGASLTAVETYPTASEKSPALKGLHVRHNNLDFGDKDKKDALTCALVAYLFAKKRKTLTEPSDSVPSREGWIWVPRDAIPLDRP